MINADNVETLYRVCLLVGAVAVAGVVLNKFVLPKLSEDSEKEAHKDNNKEG